MKAADIPMGEILLFLEKQTEPAVHWSMRDYLERKPTWKKELPPSILDAMPPAVPEKVLLAKLRGLLKKGYIAGCGCGCRGDWTITPLGLTWLAEERAR